MAKFSLSKAALESLIKHLVEIEEGKDKLLEQYFSELSQERSEFSDFIENYISHIDRLIKGAANSQAADNKIPFVTIGSEVELQDLANQEVFKYHIVSPLNGSVKAGDVSFLSPVGKSLLLKKAGDTIEVKAPGGIFRYKILSVMLQP